MAVLCPALRAVNHANVRERSYRLLDEARQTMRENEENGVEAGYDSTITRIVMRERLHTASGAFGNEELRAKDWQLDVAEAILLGLDVTLIAGTGSGKTLPFILPLLAPGHETSISVIVTPLIALQANHERKFLAYGLRAVAVNGETISAQMYKSLRNKEYRVILVSPEMALRNPQFRSLLSRPSWNKDIVVLGFDEAHCASQWGSDFRKYYGIVGNARSLLPAGVPVLAVSATMEPLVLAEVRKILHINEDTSFHLNLGNRRRNIKYEVFKIPKDKAEVSQLEAVLPTEVTDEAAFPKTIIFFDSIDEMLHACHWLRQHYRELDESTFAILHAKMSPQYKLRTLEHFQTGENLRVLLATEAAGMGCDIPQVELIIQWMAPSTLATWYQRAGRAGRGTKKLCRAILMSQHTVFQEKNKKDRMEGDPIQYVKTITPDLRRWLEAETDCRGDIADEYFDNPAPQMDTSGEGSFSVTPDCDNCEKRNGDSYVPDTAGKTSDTAGEARDMASEAPDAGETEQRGSRSKDHAAEVVAFLEYWRDSTWYEKYTTRPFTAVGLLSDELIDKFARTRKPKCGSDYKELGWAWYRTHGDQVFEGIREIDAKYDQVVANKKAAKERAKEEKALTAHKKKWKLMAEEMTRRLGTRSKLAKRRIVVEVSKLRLGQAAWHAAKWVLKDTMARQRKRRRLARSLTVIASPRAERLRNLGMTDHLDWLPVELPLPRTVIKRPIEPEPESESESESDSEPESDSPHPSKRRRTILRIPYSQ